MRGSRKGKYKIKIRIPFVGKVTEDTWIKIMNVRLFVYLCGIFVQSYRVSCLRAEQKGSRECRQDAWRSGAAASGVEGGEWRRRGTGRTSTRSAKCGRD